jgi:D-serine deaminase-like pyridoxal phosphate-dependent protein
MAATRKLRKELTYELDKLRGLEHRVGGTLDHASSSALATEIREQAEVCLKVLDRYEASVRGQGWSYAQKKCQPLREDLTRTEMLFRGAAGEWTRRAGKTA